ncbi:cyclin-domain-containing protein [Myriangium duriaei CBS 260.36]|uniref:Cyclin-domain-containing protein n=1 Tax=Myriangium duriaei CBS 260.36 TaxID=1168546 RepID=A0A9P4ML17_9PEZI|nr:cyclin-domain-containing protein [Myriangium duriaei CBS 260.36]
MALVADSVTHLFDRPHQQGDYSEHHRPSSRHTPSRSGRTTPHTERGHDLAPALAHMSEQHVDSRRSYQKSQNDSGVVTQQAGQERARDTNMAGNSNLDDPATSKGTKRAIEATKSTDNMDLTSSDSKPRHTFPLSSRTSQSPETRAPTTPSTPSTPQRIQVRDLAHIQSFANDGSHSGHGSLIGDRRDANVQYEISSMPIENIIEMVAGLLTKITTTNDMQHEHLHRQMPPPDSSGPISPQTSSVLAFHGKNVPSITILSYLNRINKYCPTSYEVFLSLLVYFDRMTEKVNSGPIQSLREQNQQQSQSLEIRNAPEHKDAGGTEPQKEAAQTATPPASGNLDTQEQHGAIPGTPHSRYQDSPASPVSPDGELNLSHFFVVDSFNIHRLVIAGVTCASKFFSDIFYTNSRYAKVGGLPLPELNHLELQFLLLNDFRLSVPVEELEAYGTMLVEFYAREVAEQERGGVSHHEQNQSVR